MIGYPIHGEIGARGKFCAGLLMHPAEAGLPLDGHLVACATCTKKTGLVRVSTEKAAKVFEVAKAAGVKPIAVAGRQLLLGDLTPKERIALWDIACGDPMNATAPQLKRLARLDLVVAVGAVWRVTPRGVDLARRAEWTVRPDRIATPEQMGASK